MNAAKDTNDTAPQVNPVVQAAADQVRRSGNRRAKVKAKDVPRWTCDGQQLSLFEISEVTG
jgi:hypothetical protein